MEMIKIVLKRDRDINPSIPEWIAAVNGGFIPVEVSSNNRNERHLIVPVAGHFESADDCVKTIAQNIPDRYKSISVEHYN